MSASGASVCIPVGVVVERRAAISQWLDFVWRPVAVLSGPPDAPIWAALGEEGDASLFYAGPAEIELYRSETKNYLDNLASSTPSVWVSLHATGFEPPYCIATVTVDPAEGEGLTEPGTALVESIAMPEPIRDAVAAFVALHHVEHAFDKRKLDRANLEALARHGPGYRSGDE